MSFLPLPYYLCTQLVAFGCKELVNMYCSLFTIWPSMYFSLFVKWRSNLEPVLSIESSFLLKETNSRLQVRRATHCTTLMVFYIIKFYLFTIYFCYFMNKLAHINVHMVFHFKVWIQTFNTIMRITHYIQGPIMFAISKYMFHYIWFLKI